MRQVSRCQYVTLRRTGASLVEVEKYYSFLRRNYLFYVFLIIRFEYVSFNFMFCFQFCVFSYCMVSCILSPHVYSCSFCICVQFYLSMPTGGTTFAFKKYHILFWRCFWILIFVAWHAKRMPHIILGDYTVYSTLSHKQCDFLKEEFELKMRVLILSKTFVPDVSNYKKNSARYDQKCISVLM